MRPAALDLFCGAAGGWSLGLKRAGIGTVAACEIDPWRRAVFSAGRPECRMYGDVGELSAARLLADLGYLPDVVVGSPPCQEISAANTQREGITDDHLFWEWLRLVLEVRPLWCAAENSPNARTSGIDGILAALDAGGYACWPLVVGADNAGANHRRKRMWLVAADADRQGQYGCALYGEMGGCLDGAVRDADNERQTPIEGIRQRPGAEPARAARDAESIGCREGRPSPGAEGPSGHASGSGDAADAAQMRERAGCGDGAGLARGLDLARGEPGRDGGDGARRDAADSDGHGRGESGGRRLGSDVSGAQDDRGHDGTDLPPALRAIGLAWDHWNGGLAGLAAACLAAGFGHVDDGLSAVLAPGVRNRAIAALGDAVVPVIPELIGRAMSALTA